MGITFFCDKCGIEMDRDAHKATLLMGEERLNYFCPTCAYAVQAENTQYDKPKQKTQVSKK